MRKISSLMAFVVLISLALTACSTPAAPSTQTEQPSLTPSPTATATPVPPKVLTVCLGFEPQSLYLYARSDRSMWSVLEAVYDGPFDTTAYQAKPVILKKLPSLADGDMSLTAVDVAPGQPVINTAGELVSLTQGVQVFPSGCTQPGCALTYDGQSPLQMDQAQITYALLDGLKWSDGQPLTAEDSVFSYQVSSDPATPVTRLAFDRTAAYTAADTNSVVWTGVAGYLPQDASAFFWLPLPKHQLGGVSAADLLTNEFANRSPLGWGAYRIVEWTPGDHIRLEKNPNYFRAAEGLPKFDFLVFRFVSQQQDGNLAALATGECDVVDASSLVQSQYQAVRQLELDGKVKVFSSAGPEWEHLDFGILPASYDDGYNPQNGDRADFFSDVRVRQAFAYCLDRKTAVDKQLLGAAAVPDGYLPPEHPLLAPDLAQYPYDPAKGSALLDEVGWKDDDSNPTTPRVAYGVANVPDGTKLSVSYLTTQAYLRGEVVKKLAELAAPCGIELKVEALTPDQLYGQGPDGPLFGRHFELAQFAWQTDTLAACYLFDSGQIPAADNYWVGANVSGYSNPEFDAACRTVRQLIAGQPGYEEKNAEAQRLFARDLPAIPLYFQLKIAVSRADLCGLDMDVSARSALWNLESFDYGEGCPQ